MSRKTELIGRNILNENDLIEIEIEMMTAALITLLLLLLKLYLHTVFSSGFNMQQTKLDKSQK